MGPSRATAAPFVHHDLLAAARTQNGSGRFVGQFGTTHLQSGFRVGGQYGQFHGVTLVLAGKELDLQNVAGCHGVLLATCFDNCV